MKMIWAVDPLTVDKSLQKLAALAIRALSHPLLPVTIEPVYLFSAGDDTDEPLFEVSSDLVEELQISAQNALSENLKDIDLPGLSPLKILSKPYSPLKQGIIELIEYANDTHANLIVTSTRAQTGIKRWVMGSFTETLMTLTNIPLFVVNPHWAKHFQFKHILFATDFSADSRKAFRQVLKFAKAIHAEVTIFHKARFGLSPRSRHKISAQARAEHMVEEARKLGIAAEVSIYSGFRKSIEDSILEQASEKPGIIALANHTGTLASTLLGSTTRKVVREAHDPVWIVHAA